MYAIVNIAGNQFKVSKDDEISVPKLSGEVGKDVVFDEVMLVSNKDKVSIGTPTVEGATVKARILGFERAKKVVVFKKKRRKGYQVKNGHRQDYTSIKIGTISMKQKKEKASDGA